MRTRNRSRPGSSVVSDDTVDSLPPETCRICLKDGDIPIFGEEDISTEVMNFGCIEISNLDNFPKHICKSCHSLLESAILFRKIARKSDEILKNTANDEQSTCAVSAEQTEEYLNDTDDECSIKTEYLEYYNTSESETDWKCEDETELTLKHENDYDNESFKNPTQSDSDDRVSAKAENEIELPSNIKEEETDNINDIENEMVMIIVSGKDKKCLFVCGKCNLTYESKTELEIHYSKYHPNVRVNQRKCEVCNKFVEKNTYMAHLKEHREQCCKSYPKVECKVCGKKFGKSYFKYHMKVHGSAEEQATRVIECSICNRGFSARYFTDHLRRVHGEPKKGRLSNNKKHSVKKLECPVCDKKVEDTNYKAHLAKHGGSTKRYICDQCGKEFKHPSVFKTHTLTHGSELKYQCQFCPYRGLHLALLKIHVRTHTGDYNYKCADCPAKFITKSNLTKHIQRKHCGVAKHKCETCNRKFFMKRSLDKHIQTVHLGLKDHVCDICGKGFGHRDYMLSHQLKVHKREKFTDRVGRMPSYLKEEMLKSSENEQ